MEEQFFLGEHLVNNTKRFDIQFKVLGELLFQEVVMVEQF
jgi:hypothetical protein